MPVAVVVITPTGKRAFRITGEEIGLDTLTEEAPDVCKLIS
jgi:uncharacterized spore protein YtfJ